MAHGLSALACATAQQIAEACVAPREAEASASFWIGCPLPEKPPRQRPVGIWRCLVSVASPVPSMLHGAAGRPQKTRKMAQLRGMPDAAGKAGLPGLGVMFLLISAI